MSIWLDWTKQIQAIAQTGEAYSKDGYDLERYAQLKAISEQMFAYLSDTPVEKVHDLFIPEQGYPTPKVDVRGGIIKDNKILLVREREDDCWTMPGGWADVCETPSIGVAREVQEESGYMVSASRLVAVKDRSEHDYRPIFPFHIYKLFFLCELEGGLAQVNLEISDIDFFAQDKLPPLSKSRVLPEDIQMMFDYAKNPSRLPFVD
ncbi:NUDIX hydrolase [Celerinatantimonas sp. MCCC 1A17872]|uniref:NUDIX hydrolase n=1 Tax=Celerinatantimonas sp. MCCC 1A17872 TaxID=3177514 RepID=UPI0038BF645C